MPQGNTGEVEVKFYSFLSSTLEGVGGQSHDPAALPQGKRAGTHFRADWGASGPVLTGT